MAHDEVSTFFENVSQLRKSGHARPGVRVLSYALNDPGFPLRLGTFASKANSIMEEAVRAAPERFSRDYDPVLPVAGFFKLGKPEAMYITVNTPDLHSDALTTMGKPRFQTIAQP